MRGSVIAVLLAGGLVVLLLVFGLTEAQTRQARSERLDNMADRLSEMEEKVGALEKRLRALEGKQKK
jgi:hypothetical protein